MKLAGYCQKCAAPIPKKRRYCDGCRPVSKYRNKPVRQDGHYFGSTAEYRRYCFLKSRERR